MGNLPTRTREYRSMHKNIRCERFYNPFMLTLLSPCAMTWGGAADRDGHQTTACIAVHNRLHPYFPQAKFRIVDLRTGAVTELIHQVGLTELTGPRLFSNHASLQANNKNYHQDGASEPYPTALVIYAPWHPCIDVYLSCFLEIHRQVRSTENLQPRFDVRGHKKGD